MEIDSIRKLIAIIDLETGSLEHVVAYIILIFGNTWLQALGLIVFLFIIISFYIVPSLCKRPKMFFWCFYTYFSVHADSRWGQTVLEERLRIGRRSVSTNLPPTKWDGKWMDGPRNAMDADGIGLICLVNLVGGLCLTADMMMIRSKVVVTPSKLLSLSIILISVTIFITIVYSIPRALESAPRKVVCCRSTLSALLMKQ